MNEVSEMVVVVVVMSEVEGTEVEEEKREEVKVEK